MFKPGSSSFRTRLATTLSRGTARESTGDLHLLGTENTQERAQRFTATGSPEVIFLFVKVNEPLKCSKYYSFEDCFEDELVPVFSKVGPIFELRLMIEFRYKTSIGFLLIKINLI